MVTDQQRNTIMGDAICIAENAAEAAAAAAA